MICAGNQVFARRSFGRASPFGERASLGGCRNREHETTGTPGVLDSGKGFDVPGGMGVRARGPAAAGLRAAEHRPSRVRRSPHRRRARHRLGSPHDRLLARRRKFGDMDRQMCGKEDTKFAFRRIRGGLGAARGLNYHPANASESSGTSRNPGPKPAQPARLRSSVSWAIQVSRRHRFGSSPAVFSS